MAGSNPGSPKKAASPKKKVARKAKKPATHPPVAQMVIAAIKALKERKGSSLAAIKKYIAANYKCDVAKLAPHIRRFVKKAVTDGRLKQTKGAGAAGSFRIGSLPKPKKAKKPKKKKAKKPKKAKKAKKPKKAKKAKKPKKAKKAKKPKAAKKTKRSAKPKKSKAKKAAKPKKAKAKKAAKKK